MTSPSSPPVRPCPIRQRSPTRSTCSTGAADATAIRRRCCRWLTRGAGDPITRRRSRSIRVSRDPAARVIGAAAPRLTARGRPRNPRVPHLPDRGAGDRRGAPRRPRAGRSLLVGVDASRRAPLCIVASGETTVHVTGDGKGGRNQEFALAMALALEMLGPRSWRRASAPTASTVRPMRRAPSSTRQRWRARRPRVSLPELYLDHNNTYAFFDRLGDLVRTGPTGTNVGDLQVILIG